MSGSQGSQITSPGGDPNILWKGLSGEGLIANQNALLVNQAAQQNLTDRATLRGLAGGLATRDPNAVAGAAVLPGIGGATSIAALTGQDDLAIRQQELGLKLAMIRASQSSMDAVYPGQGAAAKPQSNAAPDVGPFEQQMGIREGSGNPAAENKQGYIGTAQFGASRMADLGFYNPAPGEDVKANKWGGTFDIPGFPDVKTKADFLTGKNAAAAQHAVFKSHVANIDAAIAQTPGAQAFDANGLRAVAHLGGNDGMQKFVASGGHYDPADSNGVHLSDYYLKFGAGGPAALQTAFGSPHGPAGPPVATAGAAPLPAGTQVAGPGAGPSVATPDAAPGAPTTDLVGPRPLPPIGPSSPVVTPQSLANTPVNGLAAPEAAVQPTPVAAPASPATPVQTAQAAPQPQPPGVQPMTPQGFQTPRADAAQPVAPVTDENQLTAADHRALEGMKQAFKSQLNPNGAQLLQAEIDKRQATNRALSVAAWNAANPNIRATPVQGVGPNGEPGTWMVQGKNIAGFIPSTTRPAQGGYDTQKLAYQHDQSKVELTTASGIQEQQQMIRWNEMADLIPSLSTGPTAEVRAKGAAILESMGASPATMREYTGMSSGHEAEIFYKLAVATIGQAAHADMGTNNGIQAMQLYAGANPGLALQPKSNQAVINMGRVSSQMRQDYAGGLNAHFNTNQATMMSPTNPSYLHPTSEYDQAWLAKNNPQIGAAAMGILNGDKLETWKNRVNPEQAAQAIRIAHEIDPNVMVPTASGVPQRASDIMAHPSFPKAN
jgi:hypothetical protein